MEDRLPRKLVAILYADVAGYSRLTGEDEDSTHRSLNEYLNLMSSTVESHHGKVMHYAGDAVLAKFEAVVDAVSGAAEIQDKRRLKPKPVWPRPMSPYLYLAASNAALDRTEEAHRTAAEVRRIEPDFSLAQFAESQPYKDPKTLERLIARLSSAGLS